MLAQGENPCEGMNDSNTVENLLAASLRTIGWQQDLAVSLLSVSIQLETVGQQKCIGPKLPGCVLHYYGNDKATLVCFCLLLSATRVG